MAMLPEMTMIEHMMYHPLQRRSVLGDISPAALYLRVSPSHGNIPYLHELYPSPSPEEQIIRQRSSRRRVSLPLISTREKLEHDTGFLQITPSKNSKFTQLSRKRLLLSPTKTSTPKKQCVRTPKTPNWAEKSADVSLQSKLQAFSTSQLVTVLDSLVNNHPELKQEVCKSLPVPDLQPLHDKLCYLKHNVFRSLPTVRYGSSRDAYCYRRAKVHLAAFKKTCTEEGKVLLLSQSWETVIRYVLLALKYVRALPNWDDAAHNVIKQQCYQSLAAQCMVALKRSHFSKDKYADFKNRLSRASSSSKELEPCVQQIDKMVENML